MSRRPLVAGNWKMHKTVAEAEAFARDFAAGLGELDDVDLALCAPFTSLRALADALRDAPVAVYAQNMHDEPSGAYTGEVSAPMLLEAGVDGVVLGHSERRQLFGETDKALCRKLPATLEAGLQPVLCVGETEEERERGDMQRKLRHQVQEALEKVSPDRLGDLVIAYEPVWAIGTGRVATTEEAQDALGFVRALVGDRSREGAQRVRVLYGGSVKPDNAAELLALPDCDGALVGGASLDAGDLLAIARAAPRAGS